MTSSSAEMIMEPEVPELSFWTTTTEDRRTGIRTSAHRDRVRVSRAAAAMGVMDAELVSAQEQALTRGAVDPEETLSVFGKGGDMNFIAALAAAPVAFALGMNLLF